MNFKKKLIDYKNSFSKNKYLNKILKYKINTVVVCFHRVIDDESFKYQNNRPNDDLVVSSSIFEKQIKFINDHFNPISIDNIYQDNNLKNNRIIITFDDGYRDNIINALPILEKYNCPAIIYVTTGFIDNKHTAWWIKIWDIILNFNEITFENKKIDLDTFEKKKRIYFFFRKKFFLMKIHQIDKILNEIADSVNYIENKNKTFMELEDIKKLKFNKLIQLGCHTHMHQNLKILNKNELNEEIFKSKQILESNLDKKIKHFSIPFGTNNTFSPTVIDAINKFEFNTIVTTEHDVFKKKSKIIPRIGIGNNDIGNKLYAKLSGLDSLINKILKR